MGIASTPDGQGYWLVCADGGVFAFGDANFYGSMGGKHLAAPIVDVASTPDGKGYWLVASDGGIFAFGDAGFAGSMGGHQLAQAVVGLAPTADGRGYWEVASDGGIFAFGDAAFYGSMGGHRLAKAGGGDGADPRRARLLGSGVRRRASSPSATPPSTARWGPPPCSARWWPWRRRPTATATGSPRRTGASSPSATPRFRGSTGGQTLAAPVVAMAAPSQAGYWLAAADGGIFSFGVPFHGSMG